MKIIPLLLAVVLSVQINCYTDPEACQRKIAELETTLTNKVWEALLSCSGGTLMLDCTVCFDMGIRELETVPAEWRWGDK
jgi:hypothetical protein